MRKILLLTISLVCVLCLAFGLSSCKKEKKGNEGGFTVDTTEFDPLVIYGESLSLEGLKLRDSDGGVVIVESDMVGHIDITTPGTHTLEIYYEGETYAVEYSVKFRVVFSVEGVETEQLVVDASEIIVPVTPEIPGKQFEGWSTQIPNIITNNFRTVAIYKTLSSDKEDVYTWTGSGLINLEGYAVSGSKVDLYVTDEGGNSINVATVNSATNKIEYNLGSNQVVNVVISGTNVMSKSWQIYRIAEPTLTVGDGSGRALEAIKGGDRAYAPITSNTKGLKFAYTVEVSNGNVDCIVSNDTLLATSSKYGVTEITIKATNATNEKESISLKHYVVSIPQTFSVSSPTTSDGYENIWSIGSVNDEILPALKLSIPGDIGEGFYENIVYTTDSGKVQVSSNGKIDIIGVSDAPEIVSIAATFSYGGVVYKTSAENVAVRCVYGGVNISTYDELLRETNVKVNNGQATRPIVLQGNIKDDFYSVSDKSLEAHRYTEMKSTYDVTYYENLGKGDLAKVRVLIQFRSDVYGNGYEINAHNATLGMLDDTGTPKSDAPFKNGPLNFVAVGDAISVKGQDNIVFGVYDNVTINNVTLKSGDLTPDEDGTTDLSQLNYAGTTVEVLGDNVTIEYARILNGRTNLRIFGDESNADMEIHVEIKNTLIKTSREFLARIGSNRFYTTTKVNEDGQTITVANPDLPNLSNSGVNYNAKKNYDSISADKKAKYESDYINTFVTFKNVVLEDAGLFAIGMDSHFSGPLLNGNDLGYGNLLKGWDKLAKTSYGAKVTLDEDVRMYTWKKLDDIDSTTLIDCSNIDGTGLPDLTLDIPAMVRREVAEESQKYGKLLGNYDGSDYIHAGIVFFGGGKNYSVVENNIDEQNALGVFSKYEVRLLNVGIANLELASGELPFYFMVYDTRSGFSYENQENMNNKYGCLRAN